MSALLTHVAVGVLLAVALRWPAKWWPLAGLLAALPDIDHVAPFMRSRETLHNAAFCIAAPLLVWALLRWRHREGVWSTLAAGSALILTSHVLLDMLPLDPVGAWGSVGLFFPLSTKQWMLPVWKANTLDPLAVTAMTILVVILIALIVVARALDSRGEGKRRFVVPALAVAWLVAFPVAAAAGLVVERPEWSPAHLALEDVFLDLPEGRVVATVFHAGGDRAFDVRVELVSNATSISNASVQRSLMPGDRVTLSLPGGPDPRNLTSIRVRLVGLDHHLYAVAPVPLRRGHSDLPLSLQSVASEAGGTRVHVHNGGDRALPAGAVELRLSREGAPARVEIIHDRIDAGATLSTWIAVSAEGTRVELRARDDGYLHDSASTLDRGDAK